LAKVAILIFAKDENMEFFLNHCFPELWPKVFSLWWAHKGFPRLGVLEPCTKTMYTIHKLDPLATHFW